MAYPKPLSKIQQKNVSAIRYLVWVQGKKQRIKTKYVSLQISEGKINLDELKAKAKEMGINIMNLVRENQSF